MNRSVIAAGIILLAGCGSDVMAPPANVPCDEFLVEFSPVSGDTVTTPEGVRYIDVRAGTGRAAEGGAWVDLNYSGYLVNGTSFDTSCPANRTALRVRMGASEVIPGFEIGLTGMRAGGLRRIIVPPHLGYGSAAVGPIPPNSTLIFDLELVRFP